MKRYTLLLILLITVITATALHAQEPATVTGRVHGCNGSPMHQAHVQILRPNQARPLATLQADEKGGFTMTTTEQGLFLVRFSGVHHQNLVLPMVIGEGDRIEVDLQLKMNEYPSVIDSVAIIGDFNSFSYTEAEAMDRYDDSTFVIRFTTTSPELAYQLLLGGTALPGTDADSYLFDGAGNYRSVVSNTDDQVRIVFDPRLLTHSKAEALVMWSDTARIEFARIYSDIQSRRRMYEQALMDHRAAGGTMAQFSYNWTREIKQLTRRIETSSDSLLRQALLVGYLDLLTCDATKQLRQKMIRRALDEVPPSSPLWAINPRLVPLAAERAADSATYAGYPLRVIEENTDPVVQAVLLYDGLVVAHRNNEPERAREYYDRLTTEFSNTPYAGMARVEFAMQ